MNWPTLPELISWPRSVGRTSKYMASFWWRSFLFFSQRMAIAQKKKKVSSMFTQVRS